MKTKTTTTLNLKDLIALHPNHSHNNSRQKSSSSLSNSHNYLVEKLKTNYCLLSKTTSSCKQQQAQICHNFNSTLFCSSFKMQEGIMLQSKRERIRSEKRYSHMFKQQQQQKQKQQTTLLPKYGQQWASSSSTSNVRQFSSSAGFSGRQQQQRKRGFFGEAELVRGSCSRSSASSSSIVVLITLLFAIILVTQLLHVKLANAIKLQPEGREKFFWSGEQFVITCQNNNNIKNVKIRWIGPNGSHITEDRSQRIHAESSGPHGHRLVVMNATAGQDDGQYKCTIASTDDKNPRETSEFVLRLLQTTNFKDTPEHLVLPAGSGAQIQCQVEFDPNVSSATVTWFKDRIPIDMLNDSSIQMSDYDSNRQMSQLIISQLKRDHEGVYTCQAMAVTPRLSKISGHDIRLEVNYAPSFDVSKQTVWVESGKSMANRLANQNSNNNHHHQQQQQQQQHLRTSATQQNSWGRGQPAGYPKYAHHNSMQQQQHPDYINNNSSLENSNINNNIVKVELRCSCEANPQASIMWFTSSNSMYALQKGEPEHVIEQPTQELDGHNTTSVLIIAYNLDSNWQHKHETYTCSASNKLGKATKTYTIEQGDPPPAFYVAPNSKQYNAQTSIFKFTLLGPNYDPDSSQVYGRTRQQAEQMQSEIMPPVDSFRIRAESPSSSSAAAAAAHHSHQMLHQNNHNQHSIQSSSSASSSIATMQQQQQQQQYSHEMSRTQYLKRHNEPSVSWNVNVSTLVGRENNLAANYKSTYGQPQNISVNLGRLPSGQQRLFLEAHNAVGWSPNATYLGEYYIVSAAINSHSLPTIQFYTIILSLTCLIISLLENNNNKIISFY